MNYNFLNLCGLSTCLKSGFLSAGSRCIENNQWDHFKSEEGTTMRYMGKWTGGHLVTYQHGCSHNSV